MNHCKTCGREMSDKEGGKIFTVCSGCWDLPAGAVSGGNGMSEERIKDWSPKNQAISRAAQQRRARQAAMQGLAEAGQAFLTAWDKSHQLEKTDVAVRLMRAALKAAQPFVEEV